MNTETDIAFTPGELIASMPCEPRTHMAQSPLAPTNWIRCFDGVSIHEPARFPTAFPRACTPADQTTAASLSLGREAADYA